MDKPTAYNVKKKEKVEMVEGAVDITKNGRYFAKGKDSDGDIVCVAMGKDNALAHIEAGNLTKGKGW